jgi:hypothetical protein
VVSHRQSKPATLAQPRARMTTWIGREARPTAAMRPTVGSSGVSGKEFTQGSL